MRLLGSLWLRSVGIAGLGGVMWSNINEAINQGRILSDRP